MDTALPAQVEPQSEAADTKSIVSAVEKSNNSKPTSQYQQRAQPDVLCNCPLGCDKKMNMVLKYSLYRQFNDKFDRGHQNQYIQRHIKIKGNLLYMLDDEKSEKKTHRRITCKYLIPVTGSVKESYRYAKVLTYNSVVRSLDTSFTHKNGFKLNYVKDSIETHKTKADTSQNGPETFNKIDLSMDESTSKPATTAVSGMTKMNGHFNDSSSLVDDIKPKENCGTADAVNSPSTSSNDDDAVSDRIPEEEDDSCSDGEGCCPPLTKVKYIEVCQKAFMHMYGITEKRIRWQREKLINKEAIRMRYEEEEQRKKAEEMERVLSVARSLGAGCQPLYALLERENCTYMTQQLFVAIEDDVQLVRNFFHNQLWKPEDIMDMSTSPIMTNLNSVETGCD